MIILYIYNTYIYTYIGTVQVPICAGCVLRFCSAQVVPRPKRQKTAESGPCWEIEKSGS